MRVIFKFKLSFSTTYEVVNEQNNEQLYQVKKSSGWDKFLDTTLYEIVDKHDNEVGQIRKSSNEDYCRLYIGNTMLGYLNKKKGSVLSGYTYNFSFGWQVNSNKTKTHHVIINSSGHTVAQVDSKIFGIDKKYYIEVIEEEKLLDIIRVWLLVVLEHDDNSMISYTKRVHLGN